MSPKPQSPHQNNPDNVVEKLPYITAKLYTVSYSLVTFNFLVLIKTAKELTCKQKSETCFKLHSTEVKTFMSHFTSKANLRYFWAPRKNKFGKPNRGSCKLKNYTSRSTIHEWQIWKTNTFMEFL